MKCTGNVLSLCLLFAALIIGLSSASGGSDKRQALDEIDGRNHHHQLQETEEEAGEEESPIVFFPAILNAYLCPSEGEVSRAVGLIVFLPFYLIGLLFTPTCWLDAFFGDE